MSEVLRRNYDRRVRICSERVEGADSLVRDTSEDGDDTPHDHTCRQIQRWFAYPVQEHVPNDVQFATPEIGPKRHLRRNLHDNVADIENGEKCRELLVVQVQILLETSQPRSAGQLKLVSGFLRRNHFIAYAALFLSI